MWSVESWFNCVFLHGTWKANNKKNSRIRQKKLVTDGSHRLIVDQLKGYTMVFEVSY